MEEMILLAGSSKHGSLVLILLIVAKHLTSKSYLFSLNF